MPKINFYAKYYPETPALKDWPFHVRSLGHGHYPAHYQHFPMGLHPDDHLFTWEKGRTLKTLTVVFITNGRGRFRSEPSGLLAIPPDSLFILFPDVRHAYQAEPETGYDQEWIEMDPVPALAFLEKAGITPANPIRTLSNVSRLAHLFQDLFDLSKSSGYGTEQELSGYAHLIFAQVLALWKNDEPLARHTAEIERMKQFLVTDLTHSYPVAEAARHCNLSPSRLRELFKQSTGFSPKQFQLETRLTRAERLLRETRLAIAEIAAQTGFESVYHFSRQFKRKRGAAPLAYRNATY